MKTTLQNFSFSLSLSTALFFGLMFFSTQGAAQCGANICTYTTNTAGNNQCIDTDANNALVNPQVTRVNGAGVPGSLCGSGFSSNGFPNTGTYLTTLPAVELTVTPDAGFQLDVTGFSYQMRRSTGGTAGPAAIRIAYSTDGGTTWIDKGVNDAPGTSATCSIASSFTWSAAATTFSTAGTLLVRLYGFSATSTSGELQVRNFYVIGAVNPAGIPGCMNAAACNYNPAATVDNGTCNLPDGCTDATACNYDNTALCDDGTCYSIGDVCNDGNALTTSDVWQADCATCLGVVISAISPYNGFSVTEVPIPPAQAAIIDALLPVNGVGLPRTWEVRICFDDPDWEIRTLYGGAGNPDWIMATTTSFYQHIFGDYSAAGVNSALFPFLLELPYDSWFTIGDGYGGTVSTGALPSGAGSTLDNWDTSGLNFVENTAIGAAIFGLWSNPSTQGEPNVSTNGVKIAQVTSDGNFNAQFNVQFRRLNADGTLYLPVTIAYETAIAIDGTPGVPPVECQIVFFPVELLNFDVLAAPDQVNLFWTTVTEENNDYFAIERSPDAFTWTEIGKLPGMGTTQYTTHYNGVDQEPMLGLNYYRLRQVDFDGEFSYTEIKAVQYFANANTNLTIYPNPSHGDYVNVNGNTDEVVALTIFSIDGKVVMNRERGDDDFRQIDLQHLDLPAGVYTLQFAMHSGEKIFQKLTVQ